MRSWYTSPYTVNLPVASCRGPRQAFTKAGGNITLFLPCLQAKPVCLHSTITQFSNVYGTPITSVIVVIFMVITNSSESLNEIIYSTFDSSREGLISRLCIYIILIRFELNANYV